MNLQEQLKNVPSPCPWYFTPTFPRVPSSQGLARWTVIGPCNYVALNDPFGRTIAVVGMYSYVMPLTDASFVICYQRGDQQNPTPPVHLAEFAVEQLVPFEVADALLERFRPKRVPYYVEGGRVFSIEVPTTSLATLHLEFPEPLSRVDEILIIARSSAIVYEGHMGAHDSCLLIARPRSGTVDFYPQDWFNLGEFDYGYQWITRVARDSESGRVIGDGIRLAPFTLDESCRQLQA
jgi:hypothetical protein